MNRPHHIAISPSYYAVMQLVLATWSHYASHATYLRRR